MRAIFLALGAFACLTVNANNYYFSSSAGDDSRSASEAQNPSTPWRTISKLNSFFSSLAPGDAVLFNRGETFYGSIEISKSRELYGPGASNSTSPITIGAYGSGAKPIITGLQTTTNWNAIGGGIYESSLNQDNLNLVTFQGNLQPIGRWPKVTAPVAGYLTYQSHYGTSSITSNAISSAPNFSGGEVVMRKWGWILDRGIVTNQSSSTVSYNALTAPGHSPSKYEPLDGYGFFFQNHINALTELGDWMYDRNNRKVRMYFGSNSPSSYNVQVAAAENLINITSSTYLTFDNLSLVGANSNVISMNYAYNIQIANCDINFSGIDAITTGSHTTSGDITVRNCTITNSNNNAINDATGGSSWRIQNNTIRNTGIIRGMGLSGDGQYIAMSFPGGNSLIEYNEVINTGYSAIAFKGANTIVKNNFVDGFCTVKSDGGGIYSYAETGRTGRKVTGNIVLNGIGDLNGRKEEDRNSLYAGNVYGIYMDGGTSDVEITDNTAANCSGSGLEINSATNIKVINNTFYNNRNSQIYYWESAGAISNLTLTNNIVFATKRDQLISLIAGSSNSVPNWGTIDNNYYCRPIYEPDGIDTYGYSRWPSSTDDFNDGGIIQHNNRKFYSLDKWKEISRQDANTKKTTVTISELNQIRFEYNPTNSSKTISLNTSYVDVKGNAYSNSVTLAPYSSVILLRSEASPTNQPNSQTISFAPLSNKTFGDAPFNLNATASSGLPVNFRIVSGPATLSGNTVSLTGTGTVIVEASQPGNTNYSPAASVTQSFSVGTNQNFNVGLTQNYNVGSNQNCKPTFLNDGTIVLDASCGNNDGNISIMPTSGVAPFMYSKDGGANYVAGPDVGYTFSNLGAGTYKLKLKDGNGCESDVVERTVKSPNCGSAQAPVFTTCNPPTFRNNGLTVLDATCGNSDGNITITPTSGVAPFMYSIDGGATYVGGSNAGHTFTNLQAGAYRLRLKDANGCEALVVERTVNSLNCGSASSPVYSSCNPPTFLNNGHIVLDATCGRNDGNITIQPTGGVAPFMYSKDGGATYVSGPDAGYTFDNLGTGTYRLRLKDANGCESQVVERIVNIMYGVPCYATAIAAAVSDMPLLLAGEVIKTYPNPSKGQFKIQLVNFAKGNAEVSVLDAKGAVVKRSQINVTNNNNTFDFNLSGQASGLYHIKITSKTMTKTTKVSIL